MPPNNRKHMEHLLTQAFSSLVSLVCQPASLYPLNLELNTYRGHTRAGCSSGGAATSSRPASTQNSLLFSEIRENMVIMGDGSFRAILYKSINFDS